MRPFFCYYLLIAAVFNFLKKAHRNNGEICFNDVKDLVKLPVGIGVWINEEYFLNGFKKLSQLLLLSFPIRKSLTSVLKILFCKNSYKTCDSGN